VLHLTDNRPPSPRQVKVGFIKSRGGPTPITQICPTPMTSSPQITHSPNSTQEVSAISCDVMGNNIRTISGARPLSSPNHLAPGHACTKKS
jgi:hypothetical protein